MHVKTVLYREQQLDERFVFLQQQCWSVYDICFCNNKVWTSRGEVMQVGGPLTTPALLYLCLHITSHKITLRCLSPHTTALNPRGCHDSKVAGPASPVCSLPEEGTTCQRISSHPSMFLIFFMPVCTSELVYLWGVTFHQRTGCGLTLVLFLHLLSPGPHISSLLCSLLSPKLPPLLCCSYYKLWLYHHFRIYAFSASHLNNLFISLSLPFVLHSGFSLPTFLSYASPWSSASRTASAHRTRFQPASQSQPARVCMSVPGATTEAGPYHPPSSAHLLYLSAGTLPSTHTVPLHLLRAPGTRKKRR